MTMPRERSSFSAASGVSSPDRILRITPASSKYASSAKFKLLIGNRRSAGKRARSQGRDASTPIVRSFSQAIETELYTPNCRTSSCKPRSRGSRASARTSTFRSWIPSRIDTRPNMPPACSESLENRDRPPTFAARRAETAETAPGHAVFISRSSWTSSSAPASTRSPIFSSAATAVPADLPRWPPRSGENNGWRPMSSPRRRQRRRRRGGSARSPPAADPGNRSEDSRGFHAGSPPSRDRSRHSRCRAPARERGEPPRIASVFSGRCPTTRRPCPRARRYPERRAVAVALLSKRMASSGSLAILLDPRIVAA